VIPNAMNPCNGAPLWRWSNRFYWHSAARVRTRGPVTAMTKATVRIATPLGISVHDHIIVGKNGHASLKGLKLI